MTALFVIANEYRAAAEKLADPLRSEVARYRAAMGLS